MVCIQKATILRELLFTKNNLESKSDNWKIIFQSIRISLFSDFVLSVVNLVKDKDPKTASYANIYSMVESSEGRRLLEDRYKRLEEEIGIVAPNLGPEMAEQIRQQMKNERLEGQIRQFHEMKLYGKERFLVKLDDFKVKWKDPFSFLDATEDKIQDIYLPINNSNFSVVSYKRGWQEDARTFLRSLED